MNRAADSRRDFTPKQGQYLAFIHAYTLVNGRPPAEADMIRFFRVTPPTVHQMVLSLEKAGLISRKPGVPRSIAVDCLVTGSASSPAKTAPPCAARVPMEP
jgi:DNA-binding MarR family transcriptional regulator